MINWTTKDISNVLASGESQTIEFKESFSDESIETVGAFSNALGGIILIGVKDSGKSCGIQIGKKTIEDIVNRIQAVTDPRIQPNLSVFSHEDKSIVGIQVAKNTGIPVSVRGRFFKRTGKTNQRMSHEEIMQQLIASSGLSWDSLTESEATIEDLDLSLIDRFFQTANKIGRRAIPEHTAKNEFLRKLQLIKGDKPTRAALLLFGSNPDKYFPSAFLKLGRFRSPTEIIDDREVHGPLIQQLDDAMMWFKDRLTTEFIIAEQLERTVHWEYPLNAIREALINILCHRDYTSHAHSQIRLYDDRLEFWNAGALPTPLTTDVLFLEHDSIPRNRKIAEVFFYMGLIERWGSGTLRIIDELDKGDFPLPEFTSHAGQFKLVFNKNMFTDDQLRKLGLSERQIQAINYVRTQGNITNTKYQELTGISKRTASRELNALVSKKILFLEGTTGRGSVYKLIKGAKGAIKGP